MIIKASYIFISIFIFIFSNNIEIKSELNKEPNKNFINNSTRYLIGPGDSLSIKVYKLSTLNSNVTVMPDGYINLPRIESIRVEGLNLQETQNKVLTQYKKILKNPVIYIDLIKARPINVNIIGQVQRPGVYSITTNENNQISNTDGGESLTIKNTGWPTLIDGIQKAGGLKPNANVRDVLLRRFNQNTLKNDEISINLWELIEKGSLNLNYRIFDGDTIYVKRATNNSLKEERIISESNLSPSNITVTVIGEVFNPGKQNIAANSPVKLAILSSGGFTKAANKSKVHLLRLDEELIKKTEISFSAKKSKNPQIFLKDGDVVFVDKNPFAKTTSSLKTAVEPITPIINAASLYKILFGE